MARHVLSCLKQVMIRNLDLVKEASSWDDLAGRCSVSVVCVVMGK